MDNFLHNYEIIFENMNNFKKFYVDITEQYESFLDSEFISQRQKLDSIIFNNFLNI